MCLFPKIIKSKSLFKTVGSAAFQLIPCGKCKECLAAKSGEYTLRAYATYMECQDKGGFAYFDTLTYNEDNVPRCVDLNYLNPVTNKVEPLRCFNRDHVSSTLKRLRTKLFRRGYDIGNSLKFFLVSEYGGITHRPHYHVLFFICRPGIPVQVFRDCLAESWTYGFLDHEYTTFQRVVKGPGAINYVAKYVNKDPTFMSCINFAFNEKLSELLELDTEEIRDEFFKNEFKVRQYVKPLLQEFRSILPFHKQSIGFGSYIIEKFDELNYLLSSGKLFIDDSKKALKDISCPMYLQRKLFYDNVVYPPELIAENPLLEGKKFWKLNYSGIKWKLDLLEQSIDKLTARYEKLLMEKDNILSFLPSHNQRNVYLHNSLLESVNMRYVAIYELVYRNRLITSDMVDYINYRKFYKQFLEVQGFVPSSYGYHCTLFPYKNERFDKILGDFQLLLDFKGTQSQAAFLDRVADEERTKVFFEK